METAREIVKERFFREGFTYIFATINKDFWWLKQKKKVRKSSAKTDKNVHNLKKKKKNPSPNQLIVHSFLLLHIWKEYPGFNSQSYWRKSCSLLHTSWKSHPWWERAGSPIRSSTLLPEAVIWHDSGYCDSTAHVPTPLTAPAIDPWQFVQSHCYWNQEWHLQKNHLAKNHVPDCFLP